MKDASYYKQQKKHFRSVLFNKLGWVVFDEVFTTLLAYSEMSYKQGYAKAKNKQLANK